ncbi:MAG TPA: DUF4271 domain-containing protein [Bacteroidia bacterium]|jgi:hypothetical protein|nr:DUF4271 domain-containing protein [Bacteroidia bacterium]
MNISPNFRFPTTEHWVTALLFTCLLLFAWVKATNPKKIGLLFREVFTVTLSEDDNGINPASIAMFVVFICSTALLVLQVIHQYGVKLYLTTGKEFLFIALFLFLFYMAKTLLVYFSGFVFEQQQRAWEYLTEIYVYTHFLGMVLLPAALLVTYASSINSFKVLEGIFIAIGLLYIYRTIKMFILMTSKGLSVMYLFLYICALEILPCALLIKYAEMSLKI